MTCGSFRSKTGFRRLAAVWRFAALLCFAYIAPAAGFADPLPAGFQAAAEFNEQLRWTRLLNGVRILLNAPAELNKPGRVLVIYATPNGSTIEQTYGCAKSNDLDWRYDIQHVAAQVRRWLDECLAQGLLVRTDGEYPVLRVTAEGWQVLRGMREPMLSQDAGKGAAGKKRGAGRAERVRQHQQHAAMHLGDQEDLLFQKLRRLRLDLANERGIAAYMVFTDATLYAIAQEQPQTLDELAEVPGIGSRKLREYGDAVLTALEEWQGR